MSTASSMRASTDAPVNDLVSKRWSPYAFSEKRVSAADLRSLFEAARWAPSSNNEQPWRFVMATKDSPEAYARLFNCLKESNRRPDLFGAPFASLNALYVMVALGRARKLKQREGKAMVFKIGRS